MNPITVMGERDVWVAPTGLLVDTRSLSSSVVNVSRLIDGPRFTNLVSLSKLDIYWDTLSRIIVGVECLLFYLRFSSLH